MEIGTYEDLKYALATIPNDDTVLCVNVQPFVDFNVQPGGFLSDNDQEYLDAFATYADCSYIEVWNIYDIPEKGWGVIESEPYPIAVPFDAQIEYEYCSL